MKISITTRTVSNSESSRKGFASIVFGDHFVIDKVAIVEGKNGLFLSMPTYKSNSVDENDNPLFYPHCNPITKEFNESLTKWVIRAYETGQALVVNERDATLPYSVQVIPVETSGKKRACVHIYFEESFVVHACVMEGKDGKLFVSMPSYGETRGGSKKYFDYCHPITAMFREQQYDEILKIYEAGGNAPVKSGKPASQTSTTVQPVRPVSGNATASKPVPMSASGFVNATEEEVPYMV